MDARARVAPAWRSRSNKGAGSLRDSFVRDRSKRDLRHSADGALSRYVMRLGGKKMKRLPIFAPLMLVIGTYALALILTSPIYAQDVDWKLCGSHSGGRSLCFCEANGISHTSIGTIRVWMKCLAAKRFGCGIEGRSWKEGSRQCSAQGGLRIMCRLLSLWNMRTRNRSHPSFYMSKAQTFATSNWICKSFSNSIAPNEWTEC